MIRTRYLSKINRAFEVNKVVALLGPRQCGKTTLARQYVERFHAPFPFSTNFLDLEDPIHLGRLQNPRLALGDLRGLVVLDEIQRIPEIFPVLRVLVDRPEPRVKFLIMGSASRDLIRQSSESLAGRISALEVQPFSLAEVGPSRARLLCQRGGFPPSFLAESDSLSVEWREGYVRTFLERDIPQLGLQIPAVTLRRFWTMLAHYHGQVFQASEIGRALDASDTTVKRYLDILTGTFLIRRLSPWFENIAKRQVKRPKIYFRDSGIFHHLLGVRDEASLQVHPKLGASWEGFALEEIIRIHGASEEEAFFWAVHEQADLDLLLVQGGSRLGFEIKYSDAPKVTHSARNLAETLRLDQLNFVCPGETEARIDERIRIIGLARLIEESLSRPR